MEFSTKAETLASLSGLLTSARILPLVYFSFEEWKSKRGECIDRIASRLNVEVYIVRSSCRMEDSAEESCAGAFLSIPRVIKSELESAIDDVFSSYPAISDDDQVLVQPML